MKQIKMVKLVIVESPAKCQKIQSYLGDGYRVIATMGHIRALEESLDSVGIDKGWEPVYKELANKKDAISKLKQAAKGAEVILASDDDREGEGIAWHVCHILKLDPRTTPRIVFHEITKPAITAAVANPRTLDMSKVNAQQARSMLDLLVGFTISKVLWNRVGPKLSAGRCQTPALRLVVERDQEVDNHSASAFWRANAVLKHKDQLLEAQAVTEFPNQQTVQTLLQKIHTNPSFQVTGVKESVSTSNPPKPLITSTLQQEASSLHGLGPKVTMQAAQKLYEAGHITYMRTDNPQLSVEAAEAIRAHVKATYGEEFLGSPGQHTISSTSSAAEPTEEKKPKSKKAKKADEGPAQVQAQAAHEAIRPTHPDQEPEISDPTQKTVYRLIWRRATQCQMAPALTDVRKATLVSDAEKDQSWTTEQTKTKFAGWRIVERTDSTKETESAAANQWIFWAPLLQKDTLVNWQTLKADEHFTKPKGRYTEASLIADLEKKGIGRPSTFASLVSTIMDREYVEKTNGEGKTQDSHHLSVKPNVWPPTVTTEKHKVGAEKNKLKATALGKSVSEFLHKEYTDLFNYDFTAAMEQNLDQIATANKPWKSLLQETWDTYKERYQAMTSGGSSASKAARERVLADGLKVILSKKGPLFVRDPVPGSPKTAKASFASLLSNMSYDTVTVADAEKAFVAAKEASQGELFGTQEDGTEIRKKKGPYGFYIQCGETRIPYKGETVEQVQEKLKAKATFATGTDASGQSITAYERKVGDFTIKRGPYGLYFYKHTLKRVSFVKFPNGLDPEKVNVADLTGLYSDGLAKKRKFPKADQKKKDAE